MGAAGVLEVLVGGDLVWEVWEVRAVSKQCGVGTEGAIGKTGINMIDPFLLPKAPKVPTLSKARGCPFSISTMLPSCTPSSFWSKATPEYLKREEGA